MAIQEIAKENHQLYIDYIVEQVFKPTLDYYAFEFDKIRIANNRLCNKFDAGFKYRGQFYCNYTSNIDRPINLHADLYDDFHKLHREYEKVAWIEVEQVKNLLRSAFSYSDHCADLYLLLPECIHAILKEAGMFTNYPEGKPISEAVVTQFLIRNKTNIDVVNSRITRNVLGLIK